MGQFNTNSSSRGMEFRFVPPDETPQDEERVVAARADELRRQRATLTVMEQDAQNRRDAIVARGGEAAAAQAMIRVA